MRMTTSIIPRLAAALAISCLPHATPAYGQATTTLLTAPVAAGILAAGGSHRADLNANGTVAVFVSLRDDLVAGDTNGRWDVFIRDIPARVTTRIMGAGGAEPNDHATRSAISRDGQYVFFGSMASNLVPGSTAPGVFRYDRLNGQLIRLDITGTDFRITGDGRYVAFGTWPQPQLLDLQTGTTVDIGTEPAWAGFELSANGRVMVFPSAAAVGGHSTGGQTQLFAFDRQTNTYELVSRHANGTPGDVSTQSDVAVSGDGRYIVFTSWSTNLVDGDTNGGPDVFLHDRQTGGLRRVSLTPSGTQRDFGSVGAAISDDGRTAAFLGRTPEACTWCGDRADVLLYDVAGGRVLDELVNISTDGTPADAPMSMSGSPDWFVFDDTGRHVMFSSGASNLADTADGSSNLFLRDRGATPGCSIQPTPALIDVGAAGGGAQIGIATGPGCAWRAAVADPWFDVTPSAGTGPAVLTITAQPNAGVSRFGYASIAGRRMLVRQPGALATAPPAFETVSVGPDGGTFAEGAGLASISANGRHVVFVGHRSRRLDGTTVSGLYVRDRLTGRTADVGAAPGGPPAGWGGDYWLGRLFPALDAPEGSDDRYLQFSQSAPAGPSPCYLYDIATHSSTPMPCGTLSQNGRFLVTGTTATTTGITMMITDRVTQHSAQQVVPNVVGTHGAASVEISNDGRRLVIVFSQCSGTSCAAFDMLVDRQTGQRVYSVSNGHDVFYGRYYARMREYFDPNWQAFGLRRFDARPDGTAGDCQVVNRQTSGITRVPLARFALAQCSLAVADGRQVVFTTTSAVSSGDIHRRSVESHLYTVSTGTAARLSTRPDGTAAAIYIRGVSKNGRYLLGSSNSGPYATTGPGIPNVVVFDLGVRDSSAPSSSTTPTNLQATVSGSTVSLRWTAPTQAAPTAYIVEAGTTAGASNVARFDTGSLSTSLSTAAPPGVYHVRVRARAGTLISGPSNEVVVTVPASCSAPAAPASLSASANGTTVSLSWAASAGATRYVVDVGSGPGLANLLSFDTGSSATTLVAQAAPGAYYVRVRARNACGTSTASPERLMTVGCSLPTAPSGLSSSVSGRTVLLSWTALAGVTGHVLEVGMTSGATALRFDLGPDNRLTANAPPGTYYVRLRARTACGPGPASSEIAVAVP